MVIGSENGVAAIARLVIEPYHVDGGEPGTANEDMIERHAQRRRMKGMTAAWPVRHAPEAGFHETVEQRIETAEVRVEIGADDHGLIRPAIAREAFTERRGLRRASRGILAATAQV